MIRNRVGQIRESQSKFTCVRIDCVRIKRRSDGRKHRALQPSRRLPVRAQRRFHVHRRNRMIRVEPDVVLARPDHFHRLPGFLRQHRRFHGKIRKRFPPKPPAQQRNVNGHILFLRSHRRGNGVPSALRVLRRNPRFHFSAAVHCHRPPPPTPLIFPRGCNVGILSVFLPPPPASPSLSLTDFTVLPITGGCIT